MCIVTGAATTEDVRAEWDSLPQLLKDHTILFLKPDADMFGYDGYETSLDPSRSPRHQEMERCIEDNPDLILRN